MTRHVVLNATAYDGLPSGARARAACMAAALLDLGARVTVLAPHGVAFGDLVRAELNQPEGAARLQEIASPFGSARPLRRALFSRRWIAARLPSDADLFVTDFYPVLESVPTALTIHDLRYLVAPEFESPGRVAWFRRFYPAFARRAPHLVVPTQAVARDAERVLGVDPARVLVAPNALARGWRRASIRHRKPSYFLAVGVDDRRKDLATLVAAVRLLDARGEPCLPVVFVGRRGPRVERLMRSAGDLEARGLVRHVGVVTDERLWEIYEQAAALLHPSRYEGFGLTVIEALALGVPVLAGRCAAVQEVADGHASWIPAGDVEAWAAALARTSVEPPPDEDVREAGRDYALSFDWTSGARALLAVTD